MPPQTYGGNHLSSANKIADKKNLTMMRMLVCEYMGLYNGASYSLVQTEEEQACENISTRP